MTIGPFAPAYIEVLLHVNRGVDPLRDAPVVAQAIASFREWGLVRESKPEYGKTGCQYALTLLGHAVIDAWCRPLTVVVKEAEYAGI